MGLSHLRVRSKLILGFALLAAVVLLVSGLALRALGRSNDRFSDYLDGVGLRERLANQIRGAATRRAIAARNLVLVTQPADREVEKALVTQAHEDMGKALARLQEAVAAAAGLDQRDSELVAEIGRIETRYGPVALDIVGKSLNDRHDDAIAKMNAECRPPAGGAAEGEQRLHRL